MASAAARACVTVWPRPPGQVELDDWQEQIFRHTPIHNNLTQLMKSFNYDAHPMGMFISVIAGMSTFHPEANPSLQVCCRRPAAGACSTPKRLTAQRGHTHRGPARALQDPDMYLKNEAAKNVQIYRLIGKAATIAACSYRHRIGRSATCAGRARARARRQPRSQPRLTDDSRRP